jgi:hypothetical protein
LRSRASEPPLRTELFGVEQLAGHAQAIAAQHQAVISQGSNRLLARLDHNEKVLRTFNRATLAADKTRRVTPAAEWLLDNFYLIEEQIQMARRHLPREYSRELPRLANGPSAGVLRVYEIVLELISHVDAQIDAESLTAFVAAYQTVSALKLGELWAIPIMLRLALIENLQRVTTGLTIARQDRDLASVWVERLQDMAEKNPSRVVMVVADMARADLPLSSSFVAEFCQSLSRLNPVLHFARGWLEQRLAEQGLSIEQLVHQESQRQASDQVSISHSITSLRLLSAIDWREFVETLSLVEQTLRGEPADVYRYMDFATREAHRSFGNRGGAQGRPTGGRKCRAKGTGRSNRACRFLLGRQRSASAGTRGPCAMALELYRGTKHSVFSAHVLSGRNFSGHDARRIRLHAPGAGARSPRMATHFLHPHLFGRRESTGGRVDELAVHSAGEAAPAPSPRLFLRYSAG